MKTYRVFKRAARSFEEFATAHKDHVKGDMSYDDARATCYAFNADLTAAERERGIKYEFEAES